MIYLIAIFVYLLVLTGIGIYKSRQVKTQEDFTVAGRTLSPWIMVCTMLAVWIGTGSIVGNAGKTYEVGMAALFLPHTEMKFFPKLEGRLEEYKKIVVACK